MLLARRAIPPCGRGGLPRRRPVAYLAPNKAGHAAKRSEGMDSTDLALTKFGIGQPVTRMEDPKLLRGRGRYSDDIARPGALHAVMVRSRIAHGTLRGIDAAEARALPGVVAIYTAADLAGYGPIKPMQTVPMKDGSPMRAPPRPALPAEHVRFLGEVVAYVVAETASAAKDAAEAVLLDIEPLPVVTTPADALAPGAPQLHPEAPGNVCL